MLQEWRARRLETEFPHPLSQILAVDLSDSALVAKLQAKQVKIRSNAEIFYQVTSKSWIAAWTSYFLSFILSTCSAQRKHHGWACCAQLRSAPPKPGHPGRFAPSARASGCTPRHRDPLGPASATALNTEVRMERDKCQPVDEKESFHFFRSLSGTGSEALGTRP